MPGTRWLAILAGVLLGGCFPVPGDTPYLVVQIAGDSSEWDSRASQYGYRMQLLGPENLELVFSASSGNMAYYSTDPPFVLSLCIEEAGPVSPSGNARFDAGSAVLSRGSWRYEAELKLFPAPQSGEKQRQCASLLFQADPRELQARYRLAFPALVVDGRTQRMPELDVHIKPATTGVCWGLQCLGGH